MAQELIGIGSAIERRKGVLALLAQQRQVSVKEVSDALGVSEVTVRQDFAQLEREGLLQRIWGGAILPEQNKREEGPFATRLSLQDAEKQAMANAAIDMVRDGETLLLDASTSVLALAHLLKERKRDLYIVTNGLHCAIELSANPTFTVVVIGGIVRPGHASLIGTLGQEVLNNLYTSKGFFSAQGITVKQGLTESSPHEAQLKAMMVEHSQHIIAALDSTKLGRSSFTSFCPFEKIDTLITSGSDASAKAELFIAQGLEVRIV